MAKPLLQKQLRTDNDRLDWIQLARTENVGPIVFSRLISKYGNAGEALLALQDLAANGGLRRQLKIASRSDVEEEVRATEAFGAEIILLNDPGYPPLLKYIESAPPVITIKGRLELLQKSLFAIIGARNASAMGKKMAHKLASELGSLGWIITSGLARGIDAAAHQGSLKNGTVAVLAGGIDDIYPKENTGLYHQITEEGVLIAESPFGTKPHATLFPRRNRIISGISQSVLVVEAALKSGSLITTRYALEQGRDVFAIPGHPLDPRSKGCNQLIKNGAILVETIEDITHETMPATSLNLKELPNTYEKSTASFSLDSSRRIVNENLTTFPISVDELIRECQLSASEVWIVLLEMEIAGRLERLPGARVVLKEEWKSL